MTVTENKQRKRKRFKPKKPKSATKKVKDDKPKYPKKVKTCHQIHGGVCDIHDKPCIIEVAFPKKDSRNSWRSRLTALGAELHGKDSEHRCEECEKERVQNSPFKELKVDGLNEMQANRLRAEAEAWNNAQQLPIDIDESNS